MESGDGGAAGGATLLFLLQAVAADGGRAENIADVNYEDSPGNVLVDFFGRMRVFHFAALTTICAVVIVSGFSVLFHGEVLADYAFTGGTTAILLTIPVVSALLGRQHRLEREIAQREEVERANAALIARLERSLEVERELAAMKLREEKLRTLRMTMSKVLHHVNNLANNLQIVEVEYEADASLSQETLTSLRAAVHDTAREMNELAAIEDPFDEESFRIKV